MAENAGAVDVVAAIDIGTNSVHMVVAKIVATGFDVLTTEKDVVRLGEGVEGLDHLTDEAIERGTTSLVRMRRIADAHDARVRAVATSAVREASNGHVLVEKVRREAGIDIEVIDGREEARLIALGVRQSVTIGSRNVVMVDIGGGSTEVTLGNDRRTLVSQSIKIGAVRLTDRFLSSQTNDVTVRNLRSHVRSSIAALAHEIGGFEFDRLVVSSGTSETIAKVVAAARERDEPRQFNGFRFSRDELDVAVTRIVTAENDGERKSIPGIEPKRADIIVAGAVILHEITRALGVTELEYSEYALREGVLIDTIQQLRGDRSTRTNAGRDSARRLAERCSVDLVHSEHVARLSLDILRIVSGRYEVNDDLAPILEAAAILANIGTAVSYTRHHHHSHYMIRNADLVGFTPEEVEKIALVARYHRKGGPKKSHPEFAELDEDSRHDVELLAGILRIATGLDRSHDQSVLSISGDVQEVDGRDMLVLVARHTSSDEAAELNHYTAQSRAELLEEYLGDPVRITMKI